MVWISFDIALQSFGSHWDVPSWNSFRDQSLADCSAWGEIKKELTDLKVMIVYDLSPGRQMSRLEATSF